MSIIKVILVISILSVLLWVFRNRHRVGVRAGARVAMLALAVFAVVSIIDTDIPQELANLVGVTRGTDLVLYALVLAFAFTSTGLYFRSRELDRRMVLVVRANAIRDAVLADGLPGADPAGGARRERPPGPDV